MKRNVLLIAGILCCSVVFSQYDTTAPYLKTKALPDLSTLLTIDSVPFTGKMLKPGLHTIVMMYNPECGHCQTQMELFLAMPEVMSQAQIVLASTLPIYKIREFITKYKLSKYSNIYPCKDNSWVLGSFFQPRTIPVLAFYNRQSNFTFISQGNATKEQILAALKQ